MIGWALRQLVLWSAVFGLLIYAVGNNLWIPLNPAAPVASEPAPAGGRGAPDRQISNSLVYRPNQQGHVVLGGVVNGTPVRFLVDTGATFVALTLADATAAGFGRGDLVFSVRTSTANGVGHAASVKLREIRIGQFSVYDVPAYVIENLGPRCSARVS
jgi:aspartyl protease family protein